MKFIDPTTGGGADVAEAQIDVHLYRYLAAEDGDRLDVFRTAQPMAGWVNIGGVDAVEFSSAMQWACNAGTVSAGSSDFVLAKRGLLATAAMSRGLKVVAAAILAHDPSLALKGHTKGVFLERSKRATAKMPAALALGA